MEISWRRERGSNPRAAFATRRFPGEPIRPLSHPSIAANSYDFNTNSNRPNQIRKAVLKILVEFFIPKLVLNIFNFVGFIFGHNQQSIGGIDNNHIF